MRTCKKIFSICLVAIFMITNIFVYPIRINAMNGGNEVISQENLMDSYSKIEYEYTRVESTEQDALKSNYFTFSGEKINDTDTTHWKYGPNAKGYFPQNNIKKEDIENRKVFYTFNFYGTGAQIWGYYALNNGIMYVSLDNGEEILVDTFGDRRQAILASFSGLEEGNHQIKVRVAGEKQNLSSGINIDISYAMVENKANYVDKQEIAVDVLTGKNHFTYSGQNVDPDASDAASRNHWKYGPVLKDYWLTNLGIEEAKNKPGSVYATFTFTGTDVTLSGWKSNNYGKMKVTIDGTQEKIIDTYASKKTDKVTLVEYTGLTNEEHTLKIEPTGTKNSQSKGFIIDLGPATIKIPKEVATGVTLKDAKLLEGDTMNIEYSLDPINSYLPDDFKFKSENPSVATVNHEGVITGISAGTTEIIGFNDTIHAQMTVTVGRRDELHVTVLDSNDQYQQKALSKVYEIRQNSESLWTWRNDKAISQIGIVTGNKDLENVQVTIDEFKNENGNIFPKKDIKATYINEVKAFIGNAGWYSYNPGGILPTGPREDFFDVIYDEKPIKNIGKKKLQLVWLEFKADQNIQPGVYKGKVRVSSSNSDVVEEIEYKIEVLNADFKETADYTFRPDYWTYPFTTAEYYGVEPFSDEHLKILEEHLQHYKDDGGVSVVGTLVEEAWQGQTYGKTDPANGDHIRVPSLIKWIKKSNGNWEFDYTYFDQFVLLAKKVGIGNEIVMHSPMPWTSKVIYYDELSSSMKEIKFNVGNKEEYSKLWTPFFVDFKNHLDDKGWFDDVALGFDERPNMTNAFDVIDEVKNKDGKTFRKIAAYNHRDTLVTDRIENQGYNLNTLRSEGKEFKKFVEDRKKKGLKTTFYTGTEIFPNSFIKSMPAESYWTMMYAGSLDLDGFLDWAYDAWVENPLVDATHSSFQPGDTFMVYPSRKDDPNRKTHESIRSEKYNEGIRDINKLYQMREECPELKAEIDALFSTVKSNYKSKVVPNEPGWCTNGGRPAIWIAESDKPVILNDVKMFKKGIYEISKKYELIQNGFVQEAQEVMNQINSIGKVTLEKADVIKAVRKSYEALKEEVKVKVTNLDKLIQAEKELLILQEAEKEVAAEAQEVMNQIDSIGKVTLEKADVIKAVRKSYEALREEVKVKVTNLDKLIQAEKELLILQEAEKEMVQPEAPNTGDMTNLTLWIGLLGASGWIIGYESKKRNRRK